MREESNLVGCLLYTAGLEDADTELALEDRGQSMMRGDGETRARPCWPPAPHQRPPGRQPEHWCVAVCPQVTSCGF